ncbi:hypothetical protein I533_11990 [Alteromonas mediterranea MED64]|uniref:DUF2938 domain-containing protein n=1 Tax=Alteromonas mediterranea TaxID=314275 RepID=UPI0003556964|nr:DUF2938 domain-containing protein [Alteromonas mediterranea]AGP82360.1 hypothetical protein I533_11990 [Alteromonas mediterranea MED64]|tara:strand:- start:256 stop:747 length:492 start_codon:yes stop_codon:yes gene_type:complete
MQNIVFIVLIGIGATLVMDLWALLRQQLFSIAPTNWGMVGRWIGHMRKGRFSHTSIANADAVSGEKIIGWTAHYVIGIGYAVLLFLIFGEAWLFEPTLGPAVVLGIATVIAPFFILLPGMGAGVAASKTPNPNAVRLHSVLNHAVFGLGLYLAALVLRLALSL